MLPFFLWVTAVSAPCTCCICWCEGYMTLLFNYASNHSGSVPLRTWPLLRRLFRAEVFPAFSPVFLHNLIFTIEEICPWRLISEVKTGFLPALHTLSLLAMGGFRLSWEIVGKSRTPGLSGSELSSSRGAGEALCSARSISKHRPTRSAFTDWAFMVWLYA